MARGSETDDWDGGRVDWDATAAAVAGAMVGEPGGEARSMGLASVPRLVEAKSTAAAAFTMAGEAEVDGSCRRVADASVDAWMASLDDWRVGGVCASGGGAEDGAGEGDGAVAAVMSGSNGEQGAAPDCELLVGW